MKMKKKVCAALIALGLAFGSVGADISTADAAPVETIAAISVKADGSNFKYWNENSPALKALKAYVEDVTNPNSPNFIPVEDRIAVSDMEMVDEKGESPFNNDLNDFVFEYALIRASLGNEFDMSQETSVMGTIVSQVEFMLENRVPKAVDVEGYWNRPVRSHTDYRGRYW